MAQLRTMYWKEIPVQTQARDDSGVVSAQLDPRFQQGVDAISMMDGSAGSDDYLDAWEWGPYIYVEGDAAAAAESAARRLNLGFPTDFVSRIAELHRAGSRDPRPGAVDHWIREPASEG